MRVCLISGEDFEAETVEMQNDWVVARISSKTAPSGNSRAIPRENIEQIIVGDGEEWSRVSWERDNE